MINGRDAKTAGGHRRRNRQSDRRQGDRRSPPMSLRRTARRRCLPPAPHPTSWSTTMPARRCKRFPRTDAAAMIDGVIANMIVAIELIQKVIDPMSERKFGRIVNITSGSVKMPLAGLDLSSGARAGLTAFLAGVARTVAANERHHQQHPARRLRHRPAAREPEQDRDRKAGSIDGGGRQDAHRHHPGAALRRARPNSARLARSCARRRPATSPGRIC